MRREERVTDCPGPRKETTTRRNVTQGEGVIETPASIRQLQPDRSVSFSQAHLAMCQATTAMYAAMLERADQRAQIFEKEKSHKISLQGLRQQYHICEQSIQASKQDMEQCTDHITSLTGRQELLTAALALAQGRTPLPAGEEACEVRMAVAAAGVQEALCAGLPDGAAPSDGGGAKGDSVSYATDGSAGGPRSMSSGGDRIEIPERGLERSPPPSGGTPVTPGSGSRDVHFLKQELHAIGTELSRAQAGLHAQQQQAQRAAHNQGLLANKWVQRVEGYGMATAEALLQEVERLQLQADINLMDVALIDTDCDLYWLVLDRLALAFPEGYRKLQGDRAASSAAADVADAVPAEPVLMSSGSEHSLGSAVGHPDAGADGFRGPGCHTGGLGAAIGGKEEVLEAGGLVAVAVEDNCNDWF